MCQPRLLRQTHQSHSRNTFDGSLREIMYQKDQVLVTKQLSLLIPSISYYFPIII